MKKPNYLIEFPCYDGDFYLPEGWEDNSWHNDACPHAEKRSKDGRIVANIWQEFVAFEKRDTESEERYLFTICVNGDDAIFEYWTNDLEKIKELVKGVLI